METNRARAERWAAFFIREGAGALLPGMTGILILIALGSVSWTAAHPEETQGESGPARLCDKEHPSRGESRALDLEALGRGYAELRSKLSFSLQSAPFDPEKALGKPFDLGIPACRGRAERRVSLKGPVPEAYRSSKLYFMRAGSRGSASLPESVEKSPETEILLVSAPSMRGMAELPRVLGRRATRATPKLLEVLGIRCANTRVTFTEKGDEAILAEGD